jgi:hypothetical protein
LSAIAKNRKKDGAIITLAGNYNYGNIIQRYALLTFLRKNGYNFDAVKTKTTVPDDTNRAIYGEMMRFVDKYIGGYDFDPVGSLGYRDYIVGSDQVWRDWYSGDWRQFGVYFLDFLGDKKSNRIAYAASFGVDNLAEAGIDDQKKALINPLIKKFDAISVREKSGVRLVKELSRNKKLDIKVVLDPTLLLKSDDYSGLIEASEVRTQKTAKVFCYILDIDDEKLTSIEKISQNYNNEYSILCTDFSKRFQPVETWLKGFRDSEFVVTDSFHGMVFAIINNKDFVVFANHNRGVSRMENLLDTFGIDHDRLFFADDKEKDTLRLRKLDWAEINKKLDILRKDSGEWLMKQIKR